MRLGVAVDEQSGGPDRPITTWIVAPDVVMRSSPEAREEPRALGQNGPSGQQQRRSSQRRLEDAATVEGHLFHGMRSAGTRDYSHASSGSRHVQAAF